MNFENVEMASVNPSERKRPMTKNPVPKKHTEQCVEDGNVSEDESNVN